MGTFFVCTWFRGWLFAVSRLICRGESRWKFGRNDYARCVYIYYGYYWKSRWSILRKISWSMRLLLWFERVVFFCGCAVYPLLLLLYFLNDWRLFKAATIQYSVVFSRVVCLYGNVSEWVCDVTVDNCVLIWLDKYSINFCM